MALVAVLTIGGPPPSPSLSLLVAPSRAASAAPAPDRAATPELLDRSFAGVKFPDWRRQFAWRPVGARGDVVSGRRAATVFYLHEGHRIGYTVLEGDAFATPPGGRAVESPAGPVRLYRGDRPADPGATGPHGGAEWIAVFERNGRTCVLAGVVHRRETLVKLASWQGRGAVAF